MATNRGQTRRQGEGGGTSTSEFRGIEPEIEFDDPGGFATQRELYAKRLINGPFEYGTVAIRESLGGKRVEADGERTTENEDPQLDSGRVHEVDVIMHPHGGVLVCGMVGGDGRQGVDAQLRKQLQTLEEQREVLSGAIEERMGADSEVPPIGLFVAVFGGAEPSPTSRAWLCADLDVQPFHAEVWAAMERHCDTEETSSPAGWPRVIAEVRSMGGIHGGYTTALEWLRTFGLV